MTLRKFRVLKTLLMIHPVVGLAMAMALVSLCLNPFLDVLRCGRKGRWRKFDVMVDVVVWDGDGCLVAGLLVLQFARLS